MSAVQGAAMDDYTKTELAGAHRALLSTLQKCERINAAKQPQSQKTLLERRVAALRMALALIDKEETNAGRLAKFETIYKEISDNMTSIPAELEKLKAAGKEKTVRYKELFGQKLMNNYVAALFERHGIVIKKDE